jgi:hypothetical protein
MREVLEGELDEIESELVHMSLRRLTAHELELRVQAIAAHLGADRPRGRARTSFFHWLHDNR